MRIILPVSAAVGPHTHDAADVISGRFTFARLPDGAVGFFLQAQGVGVDPAYAAIAAGDLPVHGDSKHDATVASLDGGGHVPTAELGAGVADASKFLRGDQSWQAVVAAVDIKEAEADLGTEPRQSGRFTLVDAAILAASDIIIVQAAGPYTGKGTLADEAEMGQANFAAKPDPAGGFAVVYWTSPPGISLFGNVKLKYLIG